jgi:hypothetical protein
MTDGSGAAISGYSPMIRCKGFAIAGRSRILDSLPFDENFGVI